MHLKLPSVVTKRKTVVKFCHRYCLVCGRLTRRSTPAEMLYGTSLRLPGEFFGCQQTTYIESDFVKGLRRSMAKVASTAASGHDDIKGFLQPNIKTATHVYIRNDAVKSPLQQPYEGPYEVLERSEK